MLIENSKQALQVEPVACPGSIFHVQAMAADRTERFGKRLAIARMNYIISHEASLSFKFGTADHADQNGRKTCKIDMESRIRFCSALIDEPSTMMMSPA